MSVSLITPPNVNPTSATDYQQQNKYIEAMIPPVSSVEAESVVYTGGGSGSAVVKAGGVFEYEGAIYHIDSNVNLSFNVYDNTLDPFPYQVSYLAFNGTNLSLVQKHDAGGISNIVNTYAWDSIRKGYYNGTTKILDYAVVYCNFIGDNESPHRIIGWQKIQTPSLGQAYDQVGRISPWPDLFFFGHWNQSTVFNGLFPAFAGTNTLGGTNRIFGNAQDRKNAEIGPSEFGFNNNFISRGGDGVITGEHYPDYIGVIRWVCTDIRGFGTNTAQFIG